MASAGNKPYSAQERPVALRMRADLSIRPQQTRRRRYWVVKDPVALTYFQLLDEEHAILKMLDGRTSLQEIKRRFERAFAPLQMSVEQLQAFLGRLHRCGLVLSEASGQGEELLHRRGRRRLKQVAFSPASILAMRFRGVDPEPLLHRVYPYCRWLLSRPVVAAGLLLALAAAALVTVQFDALHSKLPTFHDFFNARNVVWLATALVIAKVLHELAHALTCKHFGGECHEIGVMLLAFTPCLYCNVSDSWMFSNKWHRIAITAAGMYVEIVLASICTFLWWFSEPGLLNTLCLNVMFVCSVSTLLFNGNPLLRYDGYFILSDLVEVPNLSEQSRALVSGGLAGFFLGLENRDGRALPGSSRFPLAAYGVASTVYRWIVVLTILWFCTKILKSYRLEVVALVLAAIVLAGLLIGPAAGVVRFLRHPTRRRQIKPLRAALTITVLAAAVAGLLVVPLPVRIDVPVVLEPEDAHRVYVSVPGTLVESVAAGVEVEPGQKLAQLESINVRLEVEQLTNQRDQQRLHLKNLELRLAQDPSAGPQIPTARESLADLERRLRERRSDQQRLTLCAAAGGTVLPPPGVPARPYSPGQLQAWWGNPLQRRNLGCYLETGTLFCLVGDPTRMQAVLVIGQSDVACVRTGQRVRILMDESPENVLDGTVTELARTELEVAPRELAAGRELATRTDRHGVARPVETSYQARVSLDAPDCRLLTGARGRAKILADPQPLYRRAYRYLRRTFSFEL